MTRNQTYDRACDMWNEFVQQVFQEWCEDNDVDFTDDDAYDQFCESDTNAGLVAFRNDTSLTTEASQ